MKILIMTILQIIITLLFIMIASNYYTGTFNFTCPIDKQIYSTTYVYFAGIFYFAGCVCTIFLYFLMSLSDNRKLLAYKKEREKNTVEVSEKDSTITALENKIKTLETALNSLINKDKN